MGNTESYSSMLDAFFIYGITLLNLSDLVNGMLVSKNICNRINNYLMDESFWKIILDDRKFLDKFVSHILDNKPIKFSINKIHDFHTFKHDNETAQLINYFLTGKKNIIPFVIEYDKFPTCYNSFPAYEILSIECTLFNKGINIKQFTKVIVDTIVSFKDLSKILETLYFKTALALGGQPFSIAHINIFK